MGHVLHMPKSVLSDSVLREKRLEDGMPAKPRPGNAVIPATVAVDLRFVSGRLVAKEGSRVIVEVSAHSETFWVYDQEMRDIIFTIDGRDKLFLHLDISEEGLDVIASTGGISSPTNSADPEH
jgi:hypothetical protein